MEPNRSLVSLVDVTTIADEPPVTPVLDDFDTFFHAEADQMVSLARLITGSVEAAEEIAQDSLTIVYQRWATLREPGAYLRSTVINRSRSHVRRQGLARRKLAELPVGVDDGAPGEPDVQLRAALANLGERQRTAVVLRFWADWSEAQIADALGCRPGTVKSLLSRSLVQLRKAVDR
jgi:RNA polymerase sigma-70 factor (sigma-E family)